MATAAFKNATGIAMALQENLNARLRSKRRVLGKKYAPSQKAYYVCGPQGKALSVAGININSKVAMDDVCCAYQGNQWRCWVVMGPQVGHLWCRNPTDRSIWQNKDGEWSKVMDAPTRLQTWTWTGVFWDGNNFCCVAESHYNAPYLFLFNGNEWERQYLSTGTYFWPKYIGNNEILFWKTIAWYLYEGYIWNTQTRTWRALTYMTEAYLHFIEESEDYYGDVAATRFCWDGTNIFQLCQTREDFVEGEVVQRPFRHYGVSLPKDNSGFTKGTYTELSSNASFGRTCHYIAAIDKVWIRDDDEKVRQASSATASGVDSWNNIISDGPGFDWEAQYIWNPNNEQVTTYNSILIKNPADQSLWEFDGTDWTKIADSPGFNWDYAVYTGPMNESGVYIA